MFVDTALDTAVRSNDLRRSVTEIWAVIDDISQNALQPADDISWLLLDSALSSLYAALTALRELAAHSRVSSAVPADVDPSFEPARERIP